MDVLIVGQDQGIGRIPPKFLEGVDVVLLKTSSEVESYLDKGEHPAGIPIFVVSDADGMARLEVAQSFSSFFPGVLIYFVDHDTGGLDIKTLKKNGFAELFLLPMDMKFLEAAFDRIRMAKAGNGKAFRAVKLLDIEAGEELPFGVSTYLPLNKKYVSLSSAGAVSEKKVGLLKEKGVNSLFVDQGEIDKFYEYAANRFAAMASGGSDAISETERAEKTQAAVRELFRSFIDVSAEAADFEHGRDLMEQSKKIVESYVIQKTGVDLREKFNELRGEGQDFYSHAQVVSTLAALLSLATGIGKPEELAIAGLFHDIGLDRLNVEVSVFDIQDLEAADRAYYLSHPKRSVTMLKEKRVTLMPKIVELIEKHHERIDGKGFPDSLPEHKIPPEAHLLAYADGFEYLSRRVPGKPLLKPLEIHQEIADRLGLSHAVLSQVKTFLIGTA